MFCPKCGNQPASDRMRFCPSCGFRLDGIVDLLAREGIPTDPLNIPERTEGSEKRRGIRRGAKIAFFSIVLFPIFFLLCFPADSPAPLVVPCTFFLAGLFWMLYHKLFSDDLPMQKQAPLMNPAGQPAYLPPQQSIPITSRPPIETPQPQSVAEHTTRSLGKQ